jgi:hypothetical protein
MVGELAATIIRLLEMVRLDRSPHRAIQDDDALPKCLF